MRKPCNILATIFFLLCSSLVFANEGISHPSVRKKLNAPTIARAGYDFDWKLELYGRGITDNFEESRVAGVNALGSFNYNLEFIQARVAAGFLVESGSSHSLFEKHQPENAVYLDEGFLLVRPSEYFNFKAGALNQRALEMSLLVDEIAFPGVQEELAFVRKRFSISFAAQQTLPTSYSLSTMTSDNEPLPSFNTEMIKFKLHPNNRFILNGFIGHFSFLNLPAQVAFDSQLGGNEVIGAETPQLSEFKNEFSGPFFGGEIKINSSRSFLIATGAKYLQNIEATNPEENSGYLTYVEIEKTTGSSWSYRPRLEFFVNERETAPSFYNSASYGNNNRQGYAVEFNVQNRPKGFLVKARYVDSRLLQLDPLQADTQIFLLSVELKDGV